MEGAAIAQTAHLNEVPFVVLRAISDKADDSASMDYPTFEKQAVAHSVRLVCGMMKNLAAKEASKTEELHKKIPRFSSYKSRNCRTILLFKCKF